MNLIKEYSSSSSDGYRPEARKSQRALLNNYIKTLEYFQQLQQQKCLSGVRRRDIIKYLIFHTNEKIVSKSLSLLVSYNR